MLTSNFSKPGFTAYLSWLSLVQPSLLPAATVFQRSLWVLAQPTVSSRSVMAHHSVLVVVLARWDDFARQHGIFSAALSDILAELPFARPAERQHLATELRGILSV